MARIAINGFGRIGRCIVRAAVERGEKDLEFVAAAARHGLVQRDVLLERLATMNLDDGRRALAEQRIRAHHAMP